MVFEPALLLAPQIVGKIVVVWDASWSLNNRDKVQGTFNFAQDPLAVRVLLESGVRMLYFPGLPNGEALQLSFPDVNAWFKGQGAVSDAIFQRYINNPDLQWTGQGVSRYNNAGTTRIMWDSGNFIPFILPSLLSVQHVAPPSVVQVRTVEGTCDGYVSLGTCKAYFPGTDETYACESLDPYNLTHSASTPFSSITLRRKRARSSRQRSSAASSSRGRVQRSISSASSRPRASDDYTSDF